MKIKNIDIQALVPYSDNPRVNKDAVDIVKKSLKEFGFQQPIVIDKNNEIVVGHTRFYASLELGFKEVPCLKADNLSEAQVKAYRIMDNKSSEFAQWNFGLLTKELQEIQDEDIGQLINTGYSEAEINNMLGEISAIEIEESDIPRMDETELMECPKCGYKFSEFSVSK